MQQQSSVRVDNDFARFGNKSYAINKINSVEVRTRHPHGQTAVWVWGFLAVILGLGTLGEKNDATGGGVNDTSLVLALICAVMAFWTWKRSQIIEHQLFLMTSSSEAQAISSLDGDMIQNLRDKIERAMAGQPV